MIQRIETFFRRLRRWVSRSEWGIRILDLPRPGSRVSAQTGLVLVQIDGLGRKEFEAALESGRMPFLKKLLEKEFYQAHSFYSGLPSSTPAVQGELFYGIRSAVPAFQFIDHQSGEVRVMFDQTTSLEIEKRLAEKSEGLLEGGSSYSNIYTGGAEEAHFCASSMGWDKLLHSKFNLARRTLIAILNFPSLLRVLFLMVLETILAVADAARGVIARQNLIKELRFIPVRVGVCIMLREMIGISLRMDLARGLPIIHANFLGYDEQAHRRGPDSGFAHWSLRGIDQAIARIASEARRSEFRRYDLWVYSDHGQEKVTPIESQTGFSIETLVQKACERISFRLRPDPVPESGPGGADIKGQRITRGRRQWLSRQRGAQRGSHPGMKAGPGKIRVCAMGPLGHLYAEEKLGDAEKAALAVELTRDRIIPMALYIDRDQQVIACRGEECLPLADHASHFLGEHHPFAEEVIEDLRDLCSHPDAGQLVVSGYAPEDPPVTFPNENGSHAGFGTLETHGFALLPDDTALPTREKDHIRPIDLRHAALHFLERRQIVEPFYIKSARSEKAKHTLRIMTYNVHGCLGMDGKLSPQRIARVVAQYAPDIVALQELDVDRHRSSNEDQAHAIAGHLEMEYHFHPSIRVEEERYGDAILSHYPMEFVQAGLLPGLSSAPHLEPRGALWVNVLAHGEPINVINTHLGLRPSERQSQVDTLLGKEWLGHPYCDGRVVLCGDFNLLPSSRPFKQLTRKLVDGAAMDGPPSSTFFSRVPLARIDHIFLDPHSKVVASMVPSTPLTRVASDHRPLIIDIRIEQNGEGEKADSHDRGKGGQPLQLREERQFGPFQKAPRRQQDTRSESARTGR